MRPVDRGASDDCFVHFLPTDFDAHMAALIGGAAAELRVRALTRCFCSKEHVDPHCLCESTPS
jgi:hypothetical protein